MNARNEKKLAGFLRSFEFKKKQEKNHLTYNRDFTSFIGV